MIQPSRAERAAAGLRADRRLAHWRGVIAACE
jgi:hypothetical protein